MVYLKILLTGAITILGLVLSIPDIEPFWVNVTKAAFVLLSLVLIVIDIRYERKNEKEIKKRDHNFDKLIVNSIDVNRIKELMEKSVEVEHRNNVVNHSLKSTASGWWLVREEDVGKQVKMAFLKVDVDTVFKYSYVIMINDEKLELNNNIVFIPAINSKGKHAFISLIVYPTWWKERTPVRILLKHETGHHEIKESILEDHFFELQNHGFQWWDLNSLRNKRST